ncbi:MAG: metal-dependent hydrolase [Terracidiphilus sp.]
MEPITHFLTGACIGRAGLNRKTAFATLAATLAAEAADLDVLWGFDGPVEALKHHRGITHTFLGAPFVALVVVGAVWLLYRGSEAWMRRRSKALGQDLKSPLFAVHWGWLYLTALIAALSHLLLDWTNNYGLRPFFPFNPRWYAGSFMFIAEPELWAVMLLALIVPGLLALTDHEIGARRVKFRGRGWAIFALSSMVVLGCWRWSEHARGLSLLANTQITTAPVTRMALEPYPMNPFRWHAILETPQFYQTAEINTHTGEIDSDPQTDVLYKPADTTAVEAAKRTLLGRVYQDWGTWAVIRDVGQEPAPGIDPPRLPPGQTWTTVEFTDLRFDYSFRGSGPAPTRAPLSGWVYIVDNREEAGESMDGREQK